MPDIPTPVEDAVFTCNFAVGVARPMPILPPFWTITELPKVVVPVHTGSFPAVPVPVTCAGARLVKTAVARYIAYSRMFFIRVLLVRLGSGQWRRHICRNAQRIIFSKDCCVNLQPVSS